MANFQKTGADRLYASGTVLYYARESVPDSFDYATALAQDGCFIFTIESIEESLLSDFAIAVGVYLAQRPFARIFWITNPADYASGLQGMVIDTIAGQTSRISSLAWRNLSMLIGKSSTVAVSGNNLSISPSSSEQVALLTNYGETRLNILTDAITIPLDGDYTGCLQFSIETDSSHRDLLDMGLRIYYRRVDEESFQWTGNEYYVTSQRFRVFDVAEAIAFDVILDPLNLLDAERSFLSINNRNDVKSYYRTNYGHDIHLTPDDTSRYVFAEKQETATGAIPYTLTLAGSFLMTVPEYTPPDNATGNYENNLVCGLSGLEYIQLDRASNQADTLHFVTGGQSYSADFVPDEAPPDTGEPLLSDFAITSWCYVSQVGSPPIYYAQPDESVLYQAQDDNDTFLEYLEVPTSPVPVAELTATNAFPMIPYAGIVGADLSIARQFEQQIISPKRRNQIYQLESQDTETPLSDDTSVHQGVTPQGLYAEYSGDFATLTTLNLGIDTTSEPLQLADIPRGDQLRTALQSNQLFTVINNPEALIAYFKKYNINIQGWNFDLNPDVWEQHDTIVILKFTDRPLSELAQNTGMWTLPEHFTGGKTAARLALQRIIEDAETINETGSAKERAKYEILYQALSEPRWTGILALNVVAPVEGLPEALRGLASGIDESQFYAAYVGIETTPISVSNGALQQGQSSIFALIDYQDDSVPLPTESGYNFQVTSLSVLFENSEIKDFAAEIIITLDKLFGEATQLVNASDGRNIINLKGTSENHNGVQTYAFSFTGENRFLLPGSPAITDVTIIKAQFATTPTTDNSATVRSRFSFWGNLNFKNYADFDALSFGWETEEDQRYLSFSNLGVNMVAQESGTTFTFDARNLAFDMKNSTVREDSLFNKFPLKLSAFMNSSNSINDAGYMPVTSPLGSTSIGDEWYGIAYDLELGSVGALAGNIGLVFSVIVAWSPGGDGLWLGLRLPGSSGGKKELTLQGVLKISFKSIVFTGARDEAGKMNYVLKLRNIVLKVLTLSFPPNARTEIIIFGDPDASADNQIVGWYAAYAKD